MQNTALLLGSTGLIGGHLLGLLLQDPHWRNVTALTRRSLQIRSDKFQEVIADPSTLNSVAEHLIADTVFCCLGTTLKIAGSRENFRKIDHDYILDCARASRQNGATRFIVVSSLSANPTSPIFYPRVKGQTERDLAALGFDSLSILRPSLLLGERSEHRRAEGLAGKIMPPLSFLMRGPLEKFRPIKGAQVACAMNKIAKDGRKGVTIYDSDQLASY